MNPEEILVAVRDLVYNRFLAKQAAGAWSFTDANDSRLSFEKTWRPWETLEKLSKDHPYGKVYVIGMSPFSMLNEGRSNVAILESCVQIGFQRAIDNLDDVAELDRYVEFYMELLNTCRLEIDCEGCAESLGAMDLALSWSRAEPLRDPEGIPFSFIMQRQAKVFESYFSVYYKTGLEGYSTTTSTTTTTTSTTTSSTTTT